MENKIGEKKNYPSRLKVVVDLWNGEAVSEKIPAVAPIKTIKEMAAKFKQLELDGFLRVRNDGKLPRTDQKYENDARWYLTKAAKDGLIDRPYRARAKVSAPLVETDHSVKADAIEQPVAAAEASDPAAETSPVESVDETSEEPLGMVQDEASDLAPSEEAESTQVAPVAPAPVTASESVDADTPLDDY